MGITNIRLPANNSQSWFPGVTGTSTISVTNAAAGVELLAAVASPTAPRFVSIYNDGTATVWVLVGTGTGTTPTQPSAANSTFPLDPGFMQDVVLTGDRIVGISSVAAAQSLKVSVAPGVRI